VTETNHSKPERTMVQINITHGATRDGTRHFADVAIAGVYSNRTRNRRHSCDATREAYALARRVIAAKQIDLDDVTIVSWHGERQFVINHWEWSK
jgi:hypothetical protein